MKRLVYATLLLAMAAACSKQPVPDNSRQIVARIDGDSVMTEKDYDEMLLELSRMFDVVSLKADSLIESGVDRTCVRERLMQDTAYLALCDDAAKIDSALSVYVNSGKADADFLRRYKEATATAVRKAKKVGLYKLPEPK